jgi:hypothetical protein
VGGPAMAARLYPVQWAEWCERAERGECSAVRSDFRWFYKLPKAA